MFCSSSVSLHLLRGAAAFALIAAALMLKGLGAIGSGLALVGALLLLRGCPMCWLMGLFETIAKGDKHSSSVYSSEQSRARSECLSKSSAAEPADCQKPARLSFEVDKTEREKIKGSQL
ncbi:hypothetical protein LNV08_14020 [Paucibacter sp. TC2R-5]|uniref:hypothetical protein n=1 Tax=Paucibacter sp. TC2R-5 TaxID=2893555 RepID=UPI0021E4FF24|nr:hypothetical protein [Paucibacter sp. TC2R-5]MCV2360091.1 hypothetical protein [Paucibacter sp. TC2R-5]